MWRGAGGSGSVTAASIATAGGAVRLASWSVPVIISCTGTMGNNGAVSGLTALPTTYSQGAWLYLPAGAVAAGVPAAATFYWFVASSTTAGTVYNSTFDGLSVPTAGVQTAFVTTGPGAFAGVTATTTAATITVPANTLGATGSIVGDWNLDYNNAAGNKTVNVFYSTTAGTDYAGFVGTTQIGGAFMHTAIRCGTTVNQTGGSVGASSGQLFASGNRRGTADVTGSTTIVWRLTNATATNYIILEGGNFFTVQ